MRILFVEDDDRIAQPLAEDLRHQYHVVDIAEDGYAGVESAIALKLNVIVWMGESTTSAIARV